MTALQSKITGITLLIIAVLYFLDFTGFTLNALTDSLPYILLIMGAVTNVLGYNPPDRRLILQGGIMFILGLVILIAVNFDFRSTFDIYYSTLIFILFVCAIVLYVENTGEKIFLFFAIFFLVFFFLITLVFTGSSVVFASNDMTAAIIKLWPFIIILLGTGLYINR